MYYKFSGFTQRLVGAGASAAYTPQTKYLRRIGSIPNLQAWDTQIASAHALAAQKRSVQMVSALCHQKPEAKLLGLKPLVSTESPTLIFATPTKIASEAPSTIEYLGRNRVPELQKFFQKPDGLPVHLKRGLPDQLLYRTTMALTIGGTIYCLIALYMAANPKKMK